MASFHGAVVYTLFIMSECASGTDVLGPSGAALTLNYVQRSPLSPKIRKPR